MQTTAQNLQRIRTVGDTYYHPVLWYLPEYLAHWTSNPDDKPGSVLLNNIRRIATIKRLPTPPMVEDKRIIVRMTLEDASNGQLNINYITQDLDEALVGNNTKYHTYTHVVDKELFFKYVDVFDLFYSRNRRRVSAENMEMMITYSRRWRNNVTQASGQTPNTYYWYNPTQLSDLIQLVLPEPAMRVILGRRFVYLISETEEQLIRLIIDPVDDFASQIKKGVSVNRVDNDQVMNLLNQDLIAFFK